VLAESAGREPRYGFVHELIRQTLVGALSLPRRQRLHGRVAEAIEQVYARSLENQASALAHHLYQAGSSTEPENVIKYQVLAAGRALEAAAYEEALAQLDNALSLCEGERSTRVAGLQSQRATALRSLGRTGEAVQAYEQANSLFADAGEVVKSAENNIPLMWILVWGADPRWKSVSDRALASLGDADPSVRCRLLLTKALGDTQAGDIDAGLRAFQQAREIWETINVADLNRHVFQVEMILRWFTLDFELTDRASRQAVQACRIAGDVWGQAEADSFQVMTALCVGQLADTDRQLEAAAQRAERIGHQAALWICKEANWLAAGHRGDLEGAERAALDSLAFARSSQIGWAFVDEISLGIWTQYRGRTDEAVAIFKRAIENEPVCAVSGSSQSALFLAMAQEGFTGALHLLRNYTPRFPVTGTETSLGAWTFLANVVEGFASLGRDEDAAELRPWTEALAAKGAWFWVNPRLFRTVAGIAAACARDRTRSEEHHLTAIHRSDTAHYRISQPIARDWYARMLVARGRSGDTARARIVLSEALSMYESLGMPRFARRASQRLASLSNPSAAH
jgi:tetratricopeptide (TPR) repeat protein